LKKYYLPQKNRILEMDLADTGLDRQQMRALLQNAKAEYAQNERDRDAARAAMEAAGAGSGSGEVLPEYQELLGRASVSAAAAAAGGGGKRKNKQMKELLGVLRKLAAQRILEESLGEGAAGAPV
jgi:hypothetical protein